jgi:hypothetical protein
MAGGIFARENGTTVMLFVEDENGNPVADAHVSLIVNGRGFPNSSARTDITGQAYFAWPSRPRGGQDYPTARDGIFECICTARKGRRSGTPGVIWVPQNQHRNILVVIEPTASVEVQKDALERFLDRDKYPLAKRSAETLCDDFVWGVERLSEYFDVSADRLEVTKWIDKAEIARLRELSRELRKTRPGTSGIKRLRNTQTIRKLKSGLAESASDLKVLSAGGVTLDIVTGIYGVIDSIRREDADGAVIAFSTLAIDLALIASPPAAVAWNTLKLIYGLGSALKGALTASPSAVRAIEITSLLREFAFSTACRADKHRIDISKRTEVQPGLFVYKTCKAIDGPGFAWDDAGSGALVYVDASGEKLPVRIRTAKDAKAFLDVVDYISRGILKI